MYLETCAVDSKIHKINVTLSDDLLNYIKYRDMVKVSMVLE